MEYRSKSGAWLVKLEQVRGLYRVCTSYIAGGAALMRCDHNKYFKTKKEATDDFRKEKAACR